jgi:hypothetical protein
LLYTSPFLAADEPELLNHESICGKLTYDNVRASYLLLPFPGDGEDPSSGFGSGPLFWLGLLPFFGLFRILPGGYFLADLFLLFGRKDPKDLAVLHACVAQKHGIFLVSA